MNSFIYLALIGLAAAQMNTDTDSSVERPDWQETDQIYGGPSTWKTCTVGDDTKCDDGTTCINHMWQYNGQTESGTGCWNKAVCSGTGAYDMFDGRKLQFFCS